MRKATNYLIALLSLIAVTLISSCSSDDDKIPKADSLLIWKKKYPCRSVRKPLCYLYLITLPDLNRHSVQEL